MSADPSLARRSFKFIRVYGGYTLGRYQKLHVRNKVSDSTYTDHTLHSASLTGVAGADLVIDPFLHMHWHCRACNNTGEDCSIPLRQGYMASVDQVWLDGAVRCHR